MPYGKPPKEHRIKKGEVRNPKGRPVGARSFTTLYEEAIRKLAEKNDMEATDYEEQIIMQGISRARKGDYKFYKDVLDRKHGKAHESHNIKTEGSLTISFDNSFKTRDEPTQESEGDSTGQ